MRVTVLILSLVTCFFLFLQAALVNGFSQEGSADNSAAAFGVLMSLLMLISAALVLPAPRISMILLGLCAITGIIAGSSSDYSDLIAWGIWCGLLALLSYFGLRGKRKHQAKEFARDQVARDALAANQQMAAQLAFMQQQMAGGPVQATAIAPPDAAIVEATSPQGPFCPECGVAVSPKAYFCPNCRAQLRS